jgi:hypothetical protein
MIIGRSRFNIYFLLFAAAVAATGCHTAKSEKDKQIATIRVHLEVVPDMMDFSTKISVFREHPVSLYVDKSQLLTEIDVAGAQVVEDRGGFALQIQFTRHGAWLLESCTSANMGKHLGIFSTFGKKTGESRWIAAPIISRHINDGVLTFTPDATREEAERIAIGLNNVAKKLRDHDKW